MIVYHGSCFIVNEPRIINENRALDFGFGFYTTSNFDQAKKWANIVAYRNNIESRYINKYFFDITNALKYLKILCFKEADEKWFDFVCVNRQKKYTGEYDIVIGPVADDQVYKVIVQFENGYIDKNEALKRLKTEKLCDQILFHTNKALRYLHYICSEET